jgi:hypothetical protein
VVLKAATKWLDLWMGGIIFVEIIRNKTKV